jgi:hypothetical protein
MNRTTNNKNSRVLGIANKTTADDGKRIRNILIFDNHPASLRLVREVYLEPVRPTLPEYLLVSVLLIVAFLVGMFWLA